MLTVIRDVGILPGKTTNARAFAAEVAALVRAVTGFELEIVRPVGGNPQRIGWYGRYKDLSAYEDAWAKLFAEPRFAQINLKTAEIFVPGSMHEQLWLS